MMLLTSAICLDLTLPLSLNDSCTETLSPCDVDVVVSGAAALQSLYDDDGDVGCVADEVVPRDRHPTLCYDHHLDCPDHPMIFPWNTAAAVVVVVKSLSFYSHVSNLQNYW